jgi:EmrB/QacA subfamily drug resistance transporter
VSHQRERVAQSESGSACEPDRVDIGVWKVAVVAAIGSFMAQLDATVVNVSLASLEAELHSGLTTVQWVTSGYLLALALTLPLNGWLVDRIGAKALYLWCFAAFTLSSVLCGAAWSADSLIAFRILQGMSAGLLAPMAQMMIARAAGRQMAKVISFTALPVLLAPLLGPVIAGGILQFASWRWLFLINFPVGLLALVLAFAFLPNDRGETQSRKLDLVGLALLSPALVLFLYGSDHVGDTAGILTLCTALALFAMFYRSASRKGENALIDLRLLKTKVFSASIGSMFMVNGISFAGQMLIPIYLVRACGLSPSGTGLLLAPLGLGMMCTYPFMGQLTKRFGIRRLATSGALLALAGTLPFVFLAYHGLVVAVLAVSLFVRGVGISAIGIPSITSGYASVARKDLPMATTAMNIVQRLGGPTLTTLCATFLEWRLLAVPNPAASSSAFAAAFVLLCVLHALLFLATLRLPLLVPQAEPASASPTANSQTT